MPSTFFSLPPPLQDKVWEKVGIIIARQVTGESIGKRTGIHQEQGTDPERKGKERMEKSKSKREVDERTGRSGDKHVAISSGRSASGRLTGGRGRAESLYGKRQISDSGCNPERRQPRPRGDLEIAAVSPSARPDGAARQLPPPLGATAPSPAEREGTQSPEVQGKREEVALVNPQIN